MASFLVRSHIFFVTTTALNGAQFFKS